MLLSEFGQARVGILGLGREGLSMHRLLRERDPDRMLYLYAEQEPGEAIRAQLNPERDQLMIAPFAGQDFSAYEILIRSPGISPYRPELLAAREAGSRLTSASSVWFAEHPDARTICITGTKGKSTTAALTAHLLGTFGLRVELAGNIGRPLFDTVDDADWWVVELSSYQLADLDARPGLGAILNLSDEHLDWHGGAEAYRRDKLRLIELTGGHPLIANFEDAELRRRLVSRDGISWFNHPEGYRVQGQALMHGDRELDKLQLRTLPGHHNLGNIAAALTLAAEAGYPVASPAAALDGFEALPHRLHELGRLEGLVYVDDSLSTTPVATLAALQALAGRKVTVLLGGLDRGIDWRQHAPRFRELLPYAVVGMPDNGGQVVGQLQACGVEPPGGVHLAENLESAVRLAKRLTPAGGVVLLSPGAPSFPHFRDYSDRGRKFARWAGFEVFKRTETAGPGMRSAE